MIDTLYESTRLQQLVVSSNVPLAMLFAAFEVTVEPHDGDEELLSARDATAVDDELTVLSAGGSSSSSATTTYRTTSPSKKSTGRDPDEKTVKEEEEVVVEWSATGRIGVSLAQLSSVKEVIFSFRRAESRLYEMLR